MPTIYSEGYSAIWEMWAKSYALIGGLPGSVPHTRELPVSTWGDRPEPQSDSPFAQALYDTYAGMSSITVLVQQRATERGIDSQTYLVHLPKYLKPKEDFAGVARLMEILCDRYELPETLIDSDKGKRQYHALQEEVAKISGGSDMVSQLEEQYDRWKEEQVETLIPLSSEVERFLQQLR